MIPCLYSAQLVLMARQFLHFGNYPNFFKDIDESQIEFFIDNRLIGFFQKRKFTRINKWMLLLKKRNIVDIKILLPRPEEYKGEYAFVNMQNESIFCESDDALYIWSQHWGSSDGMSVLQYAEQKFSEPAIPKSTFKVDEFRQILFDIDRLGKEIGLAGWSDRFMNAVSNLDGNRVGYCKFDKDIEFDFQGLLNEKATNVLHAAAWANVFGGMGSWNDSGPCAAAEHDRENEYNALTTQLYHQMNSAIEYAINENV